MPLTINTITWCEDANANIRSLRHKIGKCKKDSNGDVKAMWEKIDLELQHANVEKLGFDHPLCSGILNITLEPFTKILKSFHKSLKYELFSINKNLQINKELYMCDNRISVEYCNKQFTENCIENM
ncbi:5728_t:CDS:2, partial [Dentiscutata erythropus]